MRRRHTFGGRKVHIICHGRMLRQGRPAKINSIPFPEIASVAIWRRRGQDGVVNARVKKRSD